MRRTIIILAVILVVAVAIQAIALAAQRGACEQGSSSCEMKKDSCESKAETCAKKADSCPKKGDACKKDCDACPKKDGACPNANTACAKSTSAKAGVTCPVMGGKVADTKTATKSVYKGETYYFCCPGCKPKFDKDPAKYVKAAAAKNNTVICPVMGGKVADPAKAQKSVYKGKTYYFCCAGCKPKFDKDPAKYVPGTQRAAVK